MTFYVLSFRSDHRLVATDLASSAVVLRPGVRVLRCQFMAPLAVGAPPVVLTASSSGRVLRVTDSLQVGGVDTSSVRTPRSTEATSIPVVADVVDLQPVGDRPVGQFVGDAVCLDLFPGDLEVAVPTTYDLAAQPQPAVVRSTLGDLGPEPSGNISPDVMDHGQERSPFPDRIS